MHCTCPLSGVERTTSGVELHSRLRRNDFLKISRLERSLKMRWGKQWGKQIAPSRIISRLSYTLNGWGDYPVKIRFAMLTVACLLLLAPTQSMAVYLTYAQWAALPEPARTAYAAGSFDAIVDVAESAEVAAIAMHITKCIGNAKMSSRQLAENTMQFASTHPKVQTGTVPAAMFAYLVEACGRPKK